MALPGSSGSVQYGISLRWSLNTTDTLGNPVTPQTQVWAAAATSGPWKRPLITTIAGATNYTHTLPNDGVRRYYKIRHTLTGYEASTFLGLVDAKPTRLTEV